jgi:putative redox protein
MKKVSVTSVMKDKFAIESEIRGHSVVVDQPKTDGGDDRGPTPLEYFFVSLAGCVATTARIIANQKRIKFRELLIETAGDFDSRVLLGKPSDTRSGFTGITVTVEMDSGLTKEEKEDFLKEIESRCPVSDNVANTTPVSFKLKE